ncbi:MAG: class I SAM-dependent methyltransferase [Anaerolineae bacterium]
MSQSDPFSPDEFDPWAETYDRDTATQNQFPFAGYEQLLDRIVKVAAPEPGMSVLDIGTGTGNLALRFAQQDCELWCSDFSAAMLAKARQKVSEAHFVLHDLRAQWPAELNQRFDRIVSAYVFHHFETGEKAALCKILVKEHLAPGGSLLIGDLSFQNETAMQTFARSVGELWEQEPFWLAEECIPALEAAGLRASYEQISGSAGLYHITDSLTTKSGGE